MENNFQINSSSVSDRGLSEKRPQNEDSYLESPSKGIFIVADGVGGAQAGDVASQMAVEIVSEAFINLPENADTEEVMQIAIKRANEAIYQMANDLPQLSRMASTIVALHLTGNIATIGHVGDSRLYRLDPDGLLHQETDDHSVVAEEVRAGRMTPEQALSHPSRNIISRALGAEPLVEVDMKTIMFEPNTSFLLCSDGITKHIDDAELRAALYSGAEPAEICTRMKELCYSRGAEDNLTAVIVSVSPEIARLEPEAAVPLAQQETEEVTVATVRAAESYVSKEIKPLQTQPQSVAPIVSPVFTEPVKQNPPQILAEESPTLSAEVPSLTPKPEFIPTPDGAASTRESEKPIFSSSGSYHSGSFESERPNNFTLAKVLSIAAFILFGTFLGFLISSLWQRANPPEPVQVPVLQEKSSNVPLTAFEETRRLVDRDPAGYITANAATPQDAEDYYLLGRAFLLAGKFADARRPLEEAKKRLPDVEASNAKTLSTEIAIAFAVIDSFQASEYLNKNLSLANESNTNAANQPRR